MAEESAQLLETGASVVKLPPSLREGAVVAMGPVVRQVGQRPTDAPIVVAVPGQVALDAPAGVEVRP
jgi:hypothetical protein